MTVWARVHIAVLAFWVGVMLFFSAILAPIAFQTLPQAQAGDLMNRLFAPYHAVGYVSAALALIGFAVAARFHGRVRAALLIALLGATLYAGLVLSPEARTLRLELKQTNTANENPAIRARFNTLHRRAVTLNGVILIGAFVALIWAVASPPRR